MMRLACLLGAALVLGACGAARDVLGGGEAFDGKLFRSKLEASKDDPESFVIRVQKPSQSLVGAREAGRYEAVSYCVNRYGNSAATWEVGPDSPDEELVIENDVLILKGRCEGW